MISIPPNYDLNKSQLYINFSSLQNQQSANIYCTVSHSQFPIPHTLQQQLSGTGVPGYWQHRQTDRQTENITNLGEESFACARRSVHKEVSVGPTVLFSKICRCNQLRRCTIDKQRQNNKQEIYSQTMRNSAESQDCNNYHLLKEVLDSRIY